MKAAIAIIVFLGALAFYLTRDRFERNAVLGYFWVFLIGAGAVGLLFTWFTTKALPGPCCGF